MGTATAIRATLRFANADFERLVTAVRIIAFILTRLEHDDGLA